MSGFPNSPKLSKAALVVFDAPNPVPSLIEFQYNPETLTRDIKANAAEGGAQSDAFRLTGAPIETIKMEVLLDATDRLEENDDMVRKLGIHADLASFETLITPKSTTVIANTILLNLGTIEILSATAPFVLLVWGMRVLPVRISGFSITEESFDHNLNPLRAKIGLDLAVLTYSDLERTHPGYAVYLAHQVVKETLATQSRGSASSVLTQKLSMF